AEVAVATGNPTRQSDQAPTWQVRADPPAGMDNPWGSAAPQAILRGDAPNAKALRAPPGADVDAAARGARQRRG
ncbi:MAG: hypothetical protein KC657_37545, partial [Myxococcales bacterium]|nr:hypothetical protein [Myxococcales bacterium]